MFFDKRLITCKTKRDKELYTHTIEYHRARAKDGDIHYKMVRSILDQKDIIIDIDTTLFPASTRLSPTDYVEKLQEHLRTYGIMYKIIRTKKEVLDAGLGRIFGFKSSKVDLAYRISLTIPYEAFSYEYYQTLLTGIGYRICVLKDHADVSELLELFYSGMIDDYDYADLFYAHFYCNEFLSQFIVTTKYIDEEAMCKKMAALTE